MKPKPDHSRQDISCLGQTIRGSVRPKDKHEIGNVHLPHSGRDVMESGQSCPKLGRPVRLCIPSDKPDKVRTESVEIVLIAPGWPNQEWFPDLLDLAIVFPITLSPVHNLLKQTFSHHFSSASVESQPSLHGGYQGIPQGERIF